ncbi:MAG: hypothetical protein LBM12_03155 [Candidatus Nomurabacteria bacterium]|jgi:hypothetical protein|nr:hypothetical protein [Candidatus Nomurabacteria bacterium]
MDSAKNQEFQIPRWQATADFAVAGLASGAMMADFGVQGGANLAASGKSEAERPENELILELLRIGNEIETMRMQKIGASYVEFYKTTTRAAR